MAGKETKFRQATTLILCGLQWWVPAGPRVKTSMLGLKYFDSLCVIFLESKVETRVPGFLTRE